MKLTAVMLWRSVRLELLELLGEGGQGRVYKALRIERGAGLRQTVAIKILHSKTAVDTWRREFESLARVRSPYCVQVLSFERYQGNPALILEFVDGVSLAILGQACWLGHDEISEIIAQLEHGLKDLHRFGVPHGDLSPQNVLVDREGRVRILDFGLANSCEEESRLTPAFAAPERILGEQATAASDLFSLGRLEEFLRGFRDPKCSYSHPEPKLRHLRDLQPSPDAQSRLSEKICALMERRALLAGSRTRSHLVPTTHSPFKSPKMRAWLVGALVTLSVLANSSASQSPRPKAFAELRLRTRHWHFISLNGRPLGYAPLKLSLKAGIPHKLQWSSASGRGEKTLILKEGERRGLEDSDFSH